MKITYDFNNKEEREEIENFFFLKYYIKSLCFDWKKTINKILIDNNIKRLGIKYEYLQEYNKQLYIILSEAIKHLNHHEFKRIKDIYLKYRSDFIVSNQYINNEKYILMNILGVGDLNIMIYKNYLYKKYGNNI